MTQQERRRVAALRDGTARQGCWQQRDKGAGGVGSGCEVARAGLLHGQRHRGARAGAPGRGQQVRGGSAGTPAGARTSIAGCSAGAPAASGGDSDSGASRAGWGSGSGREPLGGAVSTRTAGGDGGGTVALIPLLRIRFTPRS